MHITYDHYLLVLRGELPWELLAQQGHRHLLDICATCRREAEASAAGAVGPWAIPDCEEDRSPRSTGSRHGSIWTMSRVKERLSRRRSLARQAREDLARLERHPIEDWPGVVRRGRTRLRSRPFASLLIEEAQKCVRSTPKKAAALAALVPIALEQNPHCLHFPWAKVLLVRAGAHHANALRVAGDLRAADRAFALLHRDTALPYVVRAEAASLEASLRIGQRRFEDAEGLLTEATSLLNIAGKSRARCRLLVQHANLLQTLGRPGDALALFQRAADELGAGAEPYLFLCTVTGRVNCYCDLDRPREAARLLADHRASYVEDGDDYSATLYGFFLARVELGSGRLAEAEAGFAAARDRLLDLGRDYDAILASLYLGDALLAAGKATELRRLAADLVPLFHSRGVARETLASLRLLAEAAAAETVSVALLAELRRGLEEAASPGGS